MTGDEAITDALAHVRRVATGYDEPFMRGYALGQIDLAVWRLKADLEYAEAAKTEIKRLTRPTRST